MGVFFVGYRWAMDSVIWLSSDQTSRKLRTRTLSLISLTNAMQRFTTFAILLISFFAARSAQLIAQVPSGSLLHLRADSGVVVVDGTVARWKDISGNNNDAVQDQTERQPQLIKDAAGGLPAVRFNGTQYMTATSVFPVGSDYTVAFAVRVNSYATSNNVISGNSRAHYFGAVPYLKVLHSGNFGQQATAAIAVTNTMNVAVVTYTEATRKATITINGFAAATAEVPTNTDPVIYVGAYAKANYLTGDIAEAVIFHRVLTPTEVSSLQSSWIARYRVPAPLPYSPPAAGPLVWLKADSGIAPAADSKVTRWNDCSGNGYAAWQDSAQWQPTLLPNARFNLPAVRFAGAGNFMQATSVFPTRSDYTLTFVVRLNNVGATNNVVSGVTHAHWFDGGEYAKVLHGDFNAQGVASIPVRQGEFAVVTMAYHDARRRAALFINSHAADSATVPQNLDSIIYLGAFRGGNVLAGDIAEILLYRRELSPNERGQTESYLFRKYGIPIPPAPPKPDSTFTELPAQLQLFPRGGDNFATVPIAGVVRAGGWDSIVVEVARADSSWERLSAPLQYAAAGAPFAFAPRIAAALSEYRFTVTLRAVGGGGGGRDSIIATRDSITCGDVLLICGQSNSIFGHGGQGAGESEFCRTYGLNFSRNQRDTLWAIASGVGSGGGPNIGAWGMRLARLYVQQTGVPLCVINGGVGGTTIEQHQRNDAAPQTLSTIYGSMLYRVKKSGLAAHARGMMWYQGESNTVNNYAANFRALRRDWLEDYPQLTKLYVVQIRPGCAAGPHRELRELQRTLSDSFPDVVTYSPMGVAGHDGCHYAAAGYDTIGVQLFRLFSRDFLGSTDTVDIGSPNIRAAFFTTPESNQLALVFSNAQKGLLVTPDLTIGGNIRSISDALFLNDSVQAVRSVQVVGDTLLLNLSAAYPGARISYIPDQSYAGTSVIYEGPWIVNQRGVGAFSFHRFPVRPFGTTTAAPQQPATVKKLDLR